MAEVTKVLNMIDVLSAEYIFWGFYILITGKALKDHKCPRQIWSTFPNMIYLSSFSFFLSFLCHAFPIPIPYRSVRIKSPLTSNIKPLKNTSFHQNQPNLPCSASAAHISPSHPLVSVAFSYNRDHFSVSFRLKSKKAQKSSSNTSKINLNQTLPLVVADFFEVPTTFSAIKVELFRGIHQQKGGIIFKRTIRRQIVPENGLNKSFKVQSGNDFSPSDQLFCVPLHHFRSLKFFLENH